MSLGLQRYLDVVYEGIFPTSIVPGAKPLRGPAAAVDLRPTTTVTVASVKSPSMRRFHVQISRKLKNSLSQYRRYVTKDQHQNKRGLDDEVELVIKDPNRKCTTLFDPLIFQGDGSFAFDVTRLPKNEAEMTDMGEPKHYGGLTENVCVWMHVHYVNITKDTAETDTDKSGRRVLPNRLAQAHTACNVYAFALGLYDV
jgi:hypothetical protein